MHLLLILSATAGRARAALRNAGDVIAKGFTAAAGFGPAFWQFLIGLVFIWGGVARISEPLAYFLVGLLLVWDATHSQK